MTFFDVQHIVIWMEGEADGAEEFLIGRYFPLANGEDQSLTRWDSENRAESPDPMGEWRKDNNREV